MSVFVNVCVFYTDLCTWQLHVSCLKFICLTWLFLSGYGIKNIANNLVELSFVLFVNQDIAIELKKIMNIQVLLRENL